jgi:iron-sulfur cluster repair protein YtfE (RIC family)
MDVTRILEADHRTVEELLGKIERAEGDERLPLIEELVTNLQAHMELEEQVVYPAMQPVTGKEDVEEGEKEHELARKAIADVQELAPDEPGFGAALDACKAGIDHHVKDEEDEIFPKLRKEGERALAEMATPFMTKRLALGLPMPAGALAKASTKDELAEEAANAGIDGASSMTKDELAEALSSVMAQH